jgi:replication factor C large subunit
MTHHCKNRELTVAMAAAYDLDESDVSFITGSGETTNKVQSVVEDAQERRDEAIEDNAGGAFEGAARDAVNDEDSDVETPNDDTTSTSDGPTAADEGESDDANEPDAAEDQSGLDDFM